MDIRHVSPEMPISVDHSLTLPEDFQHFDGLPLYFLGCQTATGQVALHAFTTRDGFAQQLQECLLRDPSLMVREVPTQATSGVVFHEGHRWDGASYFLPSGQTITLDGTWWDDRITSLRGFGKGTFVTFFENADLSGSSLTLASYLGWANLGALGWDNRASAVLVWPLTPQIKPLRKPDKGE